MSGPRPRVVSADARRAARGFSLLELILLMVIVAIALAIAAPQLRGFAASREVKDVAGSLVALTKWARLKAIGDGRPYRLVVDLDAGTYWLEAQRGASFKALPDSWGRRFVFPAGAIVRWEESAAAERNGYIQFDPSGRAEPATLRLIGRLGTVLDVACLAPSEGFRVIARPEEEY